MIKPASQRREGGNRKQHLDQSHTAMKGAAGCDPTDLEIFELEGCWEAHNRLVGEPLAKFSITADTNTRVWTPRKRVIMAGGPTFQLVETKTEGQTDTVTFLPHAPRGSCRGDPSTGRPHCCKNKAEAFHVLTGKESQDLLSLNRKKKKKTSKVGDCTFLK